MNQEASSTPASAAVLARVDGAVAYLDLNRPKRRNAMSSEMLADFHYALDKVETNESASVVLLRGRGPSFCSGFDLSRSSASTESTVSDPWGDRRRLRGWLELGLRIRDFPLPVVASIHGHCLAGGNLFMICSDIVLISDECTVGWPKLPVGAGFLDGALSQLIGERRAKQVSFIVGSEMSGAEAAAWGYANISVPAEELDRRSELFVRRMARAPRSVLEMRKAAINRASGVTFRESMLAGAEWDALAHADPDVDAMRGFVRRVGMKTAISEFEEGAETFSDFIRRRQTSADPHSQD